MRCVICKKTCDEADLYEGILEDGMVMVCRVCAESEGIPVIKKPSQEQLKKADVRYSVRERMERLSGMRETTDISPEQTIVQKNLSRLRVPQKKQINLDVLDDYDWRVKIERRRKKMTTSQLATATGIDYKIIQAIERGEIPSGFKETFPKLESVLGVKLLKYHDEKTTVRTPEDEKRIVDEVKRKMGMNIEDDFIITGETDEFTKSDDGKTEKIEKIRKGEFDFSRRQDMTNVTLNDLVEMKKARERQKKRLTQKKIESELIGDDIDLEIEEL